MRPVSPISKGEFLHLLLRCTPPGGWPITMAVANSGGPDSTCLMYLLNSIRQPFMDRSGLPSNVHSCHVDHSLQGLSHEMANTAKATARQLKLRHHTLKIPWGTHPYPPAPSEGQPVEEIARDARSRLLFETMVNLRARVIAYGHHADDQVETAIMRISMGSGPLGAGGMRPIRRWGMGAGSDRHIAFYEDRGMHRWIARPLLTVPKDSRNV